MVNGPVRCGGAFRGPHFRLAQQLPVNMEIADGRTKLLRLHEKQGKLEYACSLGSRGTVGAKGRQITMRNITWQRLRCFADEEVTRSLW